MKCNIKECYWNFKGYCVSESLDEHFDEDNDFEMTPSSKMCEGYLDYFEFCGCEKKLD